MDIKERGKSVDIDSLMKSYDRRQDPQKKILMMLIPIFMLIVGGIAILVMIMGDSSLSF